MRSRLPRESGSAGARHATAFGMRSVQLRSPTFAVGFTLGLVLTGVTYALGGVVRRRMERPARAKLVHPVIDGAKPIDPVNLAIGPDVEPGAGTIRLESEIDAPLDNSQRW